MNVLLVSLLYMFSMRKLLSEGKMLILLFVLPVAFAITVAFAMYVYIFFHSLFLSISGYLAYIPFIEARE